MNIYTSYFSNVGRLLRETSSKCVLFSIAGKTPDWIPSEIVKKFPDLAPKYQWWQEWKKLFGSNPGSASSRRWYWNMYSSTVLSVLDPVKLVDEFSKTGSDVFLLCWERPEKFCHRHFVAEWLNSHCDGISCKEW